MVVTFQGIEANKADKTTNKRCAYWQQRKQNKEETSGLTTQPTKQQSTNTYYVKKANKTTMKDMWSDNKADNTTTKTIWSRNKVNTETETRNKSHLLSMKPIFSSV